MDSPVKRALLSIPEESGLLYLPVKASYRLKYINSIKMMSSMAKRPIRI